MKNYYVNSSNFQLNVVCKVEDSTLIYHDPDLTFARPPMSRRELILAVFEFLALVHCS